MVQKSQYLSIDLKVCHTAPESPFDEAVHVEPSTEEQIAPTHDDDDSTPERAAKSSDQVRARGHMTEISSFALITSFFKRR